MKRLYNEYSAAPFEGNVKKIDIILEDAFKKIWEEVVVNDDVCPRDTELLCQSILSSMFAQNILRRAMDKKRQNNTSKTT